LKIGTLQYFWQLFVYCNIICSHSCNVKKVHSHSILFDLDLDCLKIHQGGKQMAFRDVLALESNIKIGLELYYQGEMASACTKHL
jgi:hypothetical protein